MDANEHLKRSLLRRAVLYAGDRGGAERVLEAVVLAQPDLSRLAEHQRDRLLIQRSREVEGWRGGEEERVEIAGCAVGGSAAQLWRSLATLDRQQREAWLLLELEGYDEIPCARAMDCSRSATKRFYEAADQVLTPLLGKEKSPAIEGVRGALESIDVEPSLGAVEERLARVLARRRMIIVIKFALLFAAMGLVAWVGYDLMRSDAGRTPARQLQPAPPTPPAELTPEEQELQDRLRQQEQDEPAGREIKRP